MGRFVKNQERLLKIKCKLFCIDFVPCYALSHALKESTEVITKYNTMTNKKYEKWQQCLLFIFELCCAISDEP